MKWDGWEGELLLSQSTSLIKSIDIFKHSTKVIILSLRVSNHKLLDFLLTRCNYLLSEVLRSMLFNIFGTSIYHLSNALKANHPNCGRHWSQEVRNKII
jgi:hypothetical protein